MTLLEPTEIKRGRDQRGEASNLTSRALASMHFNSLP